MKSQERPTASAARRVSRHHQPWLLTDQERDVYRLKSQASHQAKVAAMRGEGREPLHPVNVPRLDPNGFMPQVAGHGLRALSLFSGGGGLDLGFERAGFTHVASWDVLGDAAATLRRNRPDWTVSGGKDGDVTAVDWRSWRGLADVVHGGPPCQPFSVAGRQRGPRDERDMFPAFVQAVIGVEPLAFVAENVLAVGSPKFRPYLRRTVLKPLSARYEIAELELRAEHFGVPQQRRRFVLVGFRRQGDARRWGSPEPMTSPFVAESPNGHLPTCTGVRNALGLPDTGYDALAPTIRSSLTGPRHTTSILSSVSSRSAWERLGIWPNGVASSRDRARAFVPENGHFRLSVPDVALLQGFPADWQFSGAVYMALGQIGNAVPPPMAYSVARSVAAALLSSRRTKTSSS
jgi:DNA (cytosine-5)-methyltransferase 1